ncbi:MAG: serine--tRNA ligase [Candidatus Pacearchaeota archaeon]
MLDPKLIRENPGKVRESLKKRKEDTGLVDRWLEKDKKFRVMKSELDSLRHKRNLISEEINKLNKEGKKIEIGKKIKEAKEIAEKIKKREGELKNIEEDLQSLALNFPNLVFFGVTEKEKLIYIHEKKEKKEAWHRNYLEILHSLDIADFETATKMSGEGFFILKNEGATLLRALVNFCLDIAKKRSYREVYLPVLLNERAAINSAHIPRFKEGMYKTQDGFYLSPTEEVGLLNLYAEKIIDKEDLPLSFTAYIPSFRTEKGATKGMIRTHQFDEVELFKFTKQGESDSELKKMTEDAKEPLKLLNLPFRIKILPAWELAPQSSKTYDIDVFAQKTGWLEVSSCSNCLDFQARRARIFYEDKGKKFVHTLNGTCLGLNRVLIAILENYQQQDGSVKVPTVLQKYTGFKKIESKNRKNKK